MDIKRKIVVQKVLNGMAYANIILLGFTAATSFANEWWGLALISVGMGLVNFGTVSISKQNIARWNAQLAIEGAKANESVQKAG